MSNIMQRDSGKCSEFNDREKKQSLDDLMLMDGACPEEMPDIREKIRYFREDTVF